MKSSHHELRFLEMTALWMVEPVFSPTTYASLRSDHTITELLLFDNLVGENMYFTFFPPKGVKD